MTSPGYSTVLPVGVSRLGDWGNMLRSIPAGTGTLNVDRALPLPAGQPVVHSPFVEPFETRAASKLETSLPLARCLAESISGDRVLCPAV